MFSVRFTEEGKITLHKLHMENQGKIKKELKELTKNLSLGKPLGGRLSNFYSLSVGKYRAIYTIEKEIIMVHHVGHRKEVYENLES